MKQKGKDTTAYILEKVAPVFNKQGYIGTSLSDLTKATLLTKGAIYFNFINKEDLALKAFKLNVEKITLPLNSALASEKNSIDKLLALTKFYRNYYKIQKSRGGCPVLNVGVDTKNVNPLLFNEAKKITERLVRILTVIIKKGISNNEIKSNVDAEAYAKNIYSMIEGGIFMTNMNDNEGYLCSILDHIVEIIEEKMKV